MNPFVLDHLRVLFQGKKVLLGVSGSIAAFKATDLVRGLRDVGAQVKVVLTDSAQKFVTPVTLETLSGNPVLSSLWGNASDLAQGTHHIDTARWADVALVAPATANVIGKLANGIADDLLTTELLAFQGKVFVAPAMNPVMYAHPAVRANVARLREYGYSIIGPVSGVTACGEEGEGRMCEPDAIIAELARAFAAPSNGKRALITLGPTRSRIDPVRYITNRSSGLMGASLCWAAFRAGYQVTAVCGPTSVELPPSAEVIRVTTASEMASAVESRWSQSDVYIGTAAVLDWDVKNPSTTKLKKGSGAPELEFEQNTDILALVSSRKRPGQFVLGFAAETGDTLEYGYQKLLSKGCDAIFANDVSGADAGFESEFNGGHWISAPEAGGQQSFERMSKIELASKLIAKIVARQ